ncbi:hypothetical protein D3C73_1265240 [compost metagenome]
MGHHADDIALFITDPRNVGQRAVGVIGIGEDDLVICFQLGQRFFIAVVVAFSVSDRNDDFFAFGEVGRKRGCVIHNLKRCIVTSEFHRIVAEQRARKQTRLG